MSLLKTIKHLYRAFDEFGLNKTDIEIKRLKTAIKKQEIIIYQLWDEYDDDNYNTVYEMALMEAKEKLKRQREMLEGLFKRKERNNR